MKKIVVAAIEARGVDDVPPAKSENWGVVKNMWLA
jgi:hypothetical protein